MRPGAPAGRGDGAMLGPDQCHCQSGARGKASSGTAPRKKFTERARRGWPKVEDSGVLKVKGSHGRLERTSSVRFTSQGAA
eukprot:6191071-Pleurochrysis_carterae.AAC.1